MRNLQLARALIIALAVTISVPWSALANDDLVADAVSTTALVDSHTTTTAAPDGTFSFQIAVGIVRKDGGNGLHVKFSVPIDIELTGSGAQWATAAPQPLVLDGYGLRPVTISGRVPAGTLADEYTINARGHNPKIGNLDNGAPVHLKVRWGGDVVTPPSADTTAPTISAQLAGTPGLGGWYTSDVTVTWTISDPQSAFTSSGCGSTTLTASGSATCSATSVGGTATQTITIKIDKTAPAISAALSGTLGQNGWYVSSVFVDFLCTDAGSGVASCGPDATLAAQGGNAATGIANDVAGNSSAPLIVNVRIDTEKPTIAASAGGYSGAWTNQDVTVAFACYDATSGIAVTACPAPETYAAEGQYSSASRTVSDNAGNLSDASNTIAIKIDKTKPTVTFTGNAGTYDVDQTIAISCIAADEAGGSGLASSTCSGATGPAYSFPLGSTTLNGTATDFAGNTGSGSTIFTVKVTATGLCNLTKIFASKPLGSSLCAQLNAAAAAKARGNMQAAGNATAAYVREVRAQTGKAFTPQQAEVLIRLVGSL